MSLDPTDFCRLLLRAHLNRPGAAERLATALAAPDFPWYHALAVAHRQGLRAILAPLAVGTVPANVRVELEQAASLAQALEVVAWDRIRRASRCLEQAGLAEGTRLWPEDDVVMVVADRAALTAVRGCLQTLDPAGPRAQDGRINRLSPPALVIVAEDELPAPTRLIQVLHRSQACARELDDAALQIPAEAEPAPPLIPPVPIFVPPACAAEILAVRVGGVGDVHFTLPALQSIKAAYPDSRLVMVADSRQREHLIGRTAGLVDEVEPFDWDLRDADAGRREAARQRFRARAARADLLVSFGPLLLLAGIEHGVPTVELRVERSGGHTASQLLAGAERAGFESSAACLPPRLEVSSADRRTARTLLQSASASGRGPWITFVLGATTVYKMWPLEHFAELARQLRVLTGGTIFTFPGGSERALAAELVARAPGTVVLPDVSLLDLSPCLAECQLVVGNDTGPVHLAASLGVPTLAIFGFTDPGFTGPLGPRTATLGGITQAVPGCEERIRDVKPDAALAQLQRSFPALFS